MTIIRLKEDKRVEELPEVYEECIVHFQRLDMKVGLNLSDHRPQINRETDLMEESDFGKVFTVVSPLRLGISSANASDNHIRTKEQGGKTLNASVDLAVDTPGKFASPLRVSARRLEEPRLVLRSMSKGFEADLEININGEIRGVDRYDTRGRLRQGKIMKLGMMKHQNAYMSFVLLY